MSRVNHRHSLTDEGPQLQVAPILDMAFQLLAFFILTFQPPSAESRIDLDLPAAPAVLPGDEGTSTTPGQETAEPGDVETDLILRINLDGRNAIRSFTLASSPIPNLEELARTLSRYKQVLRDKELKVILVSDDRLKYGEAARVLSVCVEAGVDSLRLASEPQASTGEPNR